MSEKSCQDCKHFVEIALPEGGYDCACDTRSIEFFNEIDGFVYLCDDFNERRLNNE